MARFFEVVNTRSGHSFGFFRANTEDDAVRAMLAEAGASDAEPDPGVVAVLSTSWICDDGSGGEVEIEAATAQEAAEEYVADGDWGDGDETVWVDVYVTPVVGGEPQEAERYAVTVTVDPLEPGCHDGEDHDWKDGPARGSGGGIRYTGRCQRCGLLRHVDTWHSRPDTGEQGMYYTRYEQAALLDEEE